MAKRIQLDKAQLLSDAWEFLWASNLERRAAGHDWRGDTYYVTATDVAHQLRQFVAERLAGEPQGSRGRAMYGADGLRLSFNAQDAARDWLLAAVHRGVLECHNFGRGHVSGMRFRPTGQPLGPVEAKTIVAKEERRANPRPVLRHLELGSRLACQSKPRMGWSRPSANRTRLKKYVTCPRCLNSAEFKAEVVA